MTTKRVKLIAAALALVLVGALAFWVFSTRQSGVSAYSTDERVKIYDVRYISEGTNVFVPRNERLMRACERLLDKVGIRRAPWRRPPVTVLGHSLILYGRFHQCITELWLYPSGDQAWRERQAWGGNKSAQKFAWSTNSDFFFWPVRLTNSTYYLREYEETNNLVIIRVKQ